MHDGFGKITHIIVDEVHEREKNTDFLLIMLKDAIKNHPNLKVILMSATINANLFSDYFGGCPIVNVPGRLHAVQPMYLGDILMQTGYMSKEMESQMADTSSKMIIPKSSSFEDIFEKTCK